MKKVVVYLMSGPSHLANLVVSLRALRTHWRGPVWVFTWDDSSHIVEQIARDENLNIRMFKRRPKYRGKNAQFFDKIRLIQEMGMWDRVMYLDADTLPVQPVQELFDLSEGCQFLATQFNKWTTGVGGTVDKRVARLLKYDSIPRAAVEYACETRLPSVNGGVFVADPKAKILETWERWTGVCKEDVFIADEAVLHAVMADCVTHNDKNFMVATGGFWNASPKHNQLPDHQVRIWHFHGDSNLRQQKCPKGIKIWWHEYIEAILYNVGGVREWVDDIGNRHLTKLRNTPIDHCFYCGMPLAGTHSRSCPQYEEEK